MCWLFITSTGLPRPVLGLFCCSVIRELGNERSLARKRTLLYDLLPTCQPCPAVRFKQFSFRNDTFLCLPKPRYWYYYKQSSLLLLCVQVSFLIPDMIWLITRVDLATMFIYWTEWDLPHSQSWRVHSSSQFAPGIWSAQTQSHRPSKAAGWVIRVSKANKYLNNGTVHWNTGTVLYILCKFSMFKMHSL
jgi:hypothetical protein